MLNWFDKSDKQANETGDDAHLSADGQRELVDKGRYQGRPVRMYSDGSVKVATRDGWIRFRSFDEFKQHFQLN
jgi:hypothetical protein